MWAKFQNDKQSYLYPLESSTFQGSVFWTLALSERAFKMLENGMNIAGIGHPVLQLLRFKVGPGNHLKGVLLTSEVFTNLRQYEARFTEHDVTPDRSQFPNI